MALKALCVGCDEGMRNLLLQGAAAGAGGGGVSEVLLGALAASLAAGGSQNDRLLIVEGVTRVIASVGSQRETVDTAGAVLVEFAR